MILNKIIKSQFMNMVLNKIVKPQYVSVVFILKSQSPMIVFYTKKIHMDVYVDTKDYFDKYFEISILFWT